MVRYLFYTIGDLTYQSPLVFITPAIAEFLVSGYHRTNISQFIPDCGFISFYHSVSGSFCYLISVSEPVEIQIFATVLSCGLRHNINFARSCR